MMCGRAPLLVRKRRLPQKPPASLKLFFSSKTPDLETRASTPDQFKPCCVRRALIQRRKERAKRRYPPQAERINASGVRWRRVLENACAKKRRLNPTRSQRRNFGKLMRLDRCADQRRMSSMIVAAGGDHGDRAVVLDAIRIVVDALVELRGSTQGERPEKPYGNQCSDKCAPMIS